MLDNLSETYYVGTWSLRSGKLPAKFEKDSGVFELQLNSDLIYNDGQYIKMFYLTIRFRDGKYINNWQLYSSYGYLGKDAYIDFENKTMIIGSPNTTLVNGEIFDMDFFPLSKKKY